MVIRSLLLLWIGLASTAVAAIGAALGALAFIPMPYETIYKVPKK